MIIEMLLNLIYTIFSLLTFPINIPSLPGLVSQYISYGFTYLLEGAKLIDCFCNLPYLFTLVGIVIAVDVGINIYKFVMWIIKKIPMLSVS